MGLFNFFKKNKADNTPEISDRSEKNTYADENSPLNMIAEKFPNSKIIGNSLYFSEYNLSVKAEIGEINNCNGRCSVQIIFIMTHPYFDEELVESCAGIGSSRSEAVKMGTVNFCTSVLTFTLGALKCDGDHEISSDIMNSKAVFRVPCTLGVLCMGEKIIDNTDLWELLKSDISSYLGRKKAYWVKLFAAWTGNELTCEARINGIVYPELTQKLSSLIPKPDHQINYGTCKQFVLLIQKDETYKPCPYTKDQVQKLTYNAIEKMFSINSQQKYEEVMSDIVSSCPVKSLGFELSAFIPEIYCQLLLNIKDGDSITAYNAETKTTVSLKKSQLCSYAYIENAVYRYISEKSPSKEQNLRVLSISSRFNAVNEAVMNGSKIEDLSFTSLIYTVENDYEVW
ncbi:MAG: hypothetical protein J6B75_04290 [Ruminococcus sp.]|nr:hypothetical protein [Ruminococcus sp.]